MGIQLGLKYETIRFRLQKRIREGSIETLQTEIEGSAWCYFCKQKIEDMAMVLTDHYKILGHDGESNYFLHSTCYRNCKN